MADVPADKSSEEKVAADVGPDPVWGIGVFVVGLIIMAVGGANTWHWVFNVGEGLLLIGAAVFLACVTITSLKREPVDWRESLRSLIRGDDEEDEADEDDEDDEDAEDEA